MPDTTIDWHCKPFHQLTSLELYRILQLRNAVFVVEQNCVYQDCDDKDQEAWHLFALENDIVIAYSRLLPPGSSYPDASSIGRVITAIDSRKRKLGKDLMQRSIEEINKLFQNFPIVISAQVYLKRFYESFGFIAEGEIYEEDGIPHIQMRKISH